jgi:hypothetical protein
MWDKINVYQYQQFAEALKETDPIEQNVKLIAILNNWTINQVDQLSVERYIAEKEKLKFLSEEITGKPVRFIKVGKKRYRCIYDIRKIPAARYIESKHFLGDYVGNLHKLAASMVIPQKRFLFWFVNAKYDASRHEEYSQDMLEAKISDVYQSVVFFYHVYRNWIEVSKVYLVRELSKEMTKDQAIEVVANLISSMDGSIAPKLLPITKIAEFRKRMN